MCFAHVSIHFNNIMAVSKMAGTSDADALIGHCPPNINLIYNQDIGNISYSYSKHVKLCTLPSRDESSMHRDTLIPRYAYRIARKVSRYLYY